MEGWKKGTVEGWKDGRMEGWTGWTGWTCGNPRAKDPMVVADLEGCPLQARKQNIAPTSCGVPIHPFEPVLRKC
jgi:hypothetical protein